MTVVLCIFTANKNGVAFQLHPEELKQDKLLSFFANKNSVGVKNDRE
jgi:hypothetical protein